MTAPARLLFALLVAATFGAFFVAQRLKHVPTVLQQVRDRRVFSPNGDGRLDKLRIAFQLKSDDTISVDVLDAGGGEVRSLVSDRSVRRQRDVRVVWNGRDDSGHRAPDGIYRVRVTLRDEGRAAVIRHRYRLDTTPPRPVVAGAAPSIFGGTGKVTIRTAKTGREPAISIYRTSGGPKQLVAHMPLVDASATWDGTSAGKPVGPGTYVAVAEWRDRAGNLGTSVPIDARTQLPETRYGARWPGKGGITIRHLEIQPPSEPVRGGAPLVVGVDARGARYEWWLRRIGTPRPVQRGVTRKSPLRLTAPAGRSAIYLLHVRSGRYRANAAIPVRAVAHRPVLVVLPVMTWQGRNPVDDDGDGQPNLLDDGAEVRVDRVYAGGRLPAGLRQAEAPLLAYLDRHRRRYELTTDVALAAGRGPKLAGHRGVLLPGDVRWLPRDLAARLRRFVRGGGTLVLTGLDSLRRDVTLTAGRELLRPTAAAPTNLFGSKLKPVVREPVTVTNLNDKIQMFSGDVFGGTGVLSGFPGYEATAALGGDEQLLANAVTPDGKTVVVAARFGRGLELRTGLADFATRLNADANAGELMLRAWTYLVQG